MQRSGYLSVKEAAERYGVSRAKIHRLIKSGRLKTSKDARDERVTLLRVEDIEDIFAPQITGLDTDESEGTLEGIPGHLTPELRRRVDEIRLRISGGRPFGGDSTDLIREERSKRTRQIKQAATKPVDDEIDYSG